MHESNAAVGGMDWLQTSLRLQITLIAIVVLAMHVSGTLFATSEPRYAGVSATCGID